MMKRSSGWGRLQAYMLNELQPLYDRLGFEASSKKNPKNDTDQNRRGQMKISWMKSYESRCWQHFADWGTMNAANRLQIFWRYQSV